MTTAEQRAVAAQVQTAARVSERRACRFVGLARSSKRYRPQRADDGALRTQLEQFGAETVRLLVRPL